MTGWAFAASSDPGLVNTCDPDRDDTLNSGPGQLVHVRPGVRVPGKHLPEWYDEEKSS